MSVLLHCSEEAVGLGCSGKRWEQTQSVQVFAHGFLAQSILAQHSNVCCSVFACSRVFSQTIKQASRTPTSRCGGGPPPCPPPVSLVGTASAPGVETRRLASAWAAGMHDPGTSSPPDILTLGFVVHHRYAMCSTLSFHSTT